MIAARWDLGLIPWATQRKGPLPYPLSPGARPTFSKEEAVPASRRDPLFPNPPDLPGVGGKVSSRAEVQAETWGLGAGGWGAWAPPWPVCPKRTAQRPPLPWELYLARRG